MFCYGNGKPTLNNCVFRQNYSGAVGGGMVSRSESNLNNCVFQDNSSLDQSYSDFHYPENTPTLTNCTFAECCKVYPTVGYIDNGGNLFADEPYVACTDCRADVNCDGIVDAADLGLLLSAWGSDIIQYDTDAPEDNCLVQ